MIDVQRIAETAGGPVIDIQRIAETTGRPVIDVQRIGDTSGEPAINFLKRRVHPRPSPSYRKTCRSHWSIRVPGGLRLASRAAYATSTPMRVPYEGTSRL